MPGYQSPEKCWLHIVVSMNNSIACGNYGPSIRNFDSWINFSNPINSLSHYLRFALYDTFAHYILLKQIISFGKPIKQLCMSFMASKTSCKYVRISSSAIYHLFCAVDVGYEIFISKASLFN